MTNRKLEVNDNDATHTDERAIVWEPLERLKEEHSARLELLSQNKKELQRQFDRIRQTIEKLLDLYYHYTTLGEKMKLHFEKCITILAVLTTFGKIISTIFISIQNVLRVSSAIGGSGGYNSFI